MQPDFELVFQVAHEPQSRQADQVAPRVVGSRHEKGVAAWNLVGAKATRFVGAQDDRFQVHGFGPTLGDRPGVRALEGFASVFVDPDDDQRVGGGVAVRLQDHTPHEMPASAEHQGQVRELLVRLVRTNGFEFGGLEPRGAGQELDPARSVRQPEAPVRVGADG